MYIQLHGARGCLYIRVHGKLWSLVIATCRVQGDEFMERLCGVWGELNRVVIIPAIIYMYNAFILQR